MFPHLHLACFIIIAIVSPAPNVSYLAPGRSQSLSEIPDLSDETIEMMDREVKKEERIVEAARRLAELPSTSKKDRQQRRDSLKQ